MGWRLDLDEGEIGSRWGGDWISMKGRLDLDEGEIGSR